MTLVTDDEAIRSRLPPEVMTAPWGATLKKGAALGFGPGLGTGDAQWTRLKEVLVAPHPLVLDADALTLLSTHAEEAAELIRRRSAPTALTPHPKEASRLLGASTEEIQRDRYGSARRLQERYGAHVLLKGRGTVIASPRRPLVVVTAGDAGLSKGGTGDLLTGVITGLFAQGLDAPRALALGAHLHGRASELLTAASGHSRSSLASDIALRLTEAFAELSPRK